MKNDHIRGLIFFAAGLVVGVTAVFLQMQQIQYRNPREAAILMRTALASCRLSALKTLRDEDPGRLPPSLKPSPMRMNLN